MARFLTPVSDRITQQFGENPDYYRSLGQLGHTGIDYGCSLGTAVRATGDGRVSFAGPGANHGGFLSVAGNAILLDHGDIYSAYSHLSRFAVSQGQQVSQGQVIGYSGNTGQVTGPHLHFEFWGKPTNWQNGWSGRLNPNNYLSSAIAGGGEVMNYDDGVALYRTGLHREPENDSAARSMVGMTPRSAMDNFRGSEEWLNQNHKIVYFDQVNAQLQEANARIAQLIQRPDVSPELTAQLEKLRDENEIALEKNSELEKRKMELESVQRADKEAGESLLRRLGQFVSKYIPGLK